MRRLPRIFLIFSCTFSIAADDPQQPSFDTHEMVDLFPILPWDVLHGWKPPHRNRNHGLESIAECNFTLAGFVTPEDLPLCEKLGLATIMAPSVSDKPWFGRWREMSAEEIDRAVKEIVEATGDSPSVLGYFIMDEPGSPAFPALAQAVAAVKKHAPGKLAYINLFPGYATVGAPDKSQLGTATYTEYLERFINGVKPPIMVSEFQDEQSHDFVMLLNLSLERSANIKISTAKEYQTKQIFSAEGGRLLPLDEQNGYWLLAGHGVLIKLD